MKWMKFGFSVGDVSVPFCVQSCSKVITYAIAQTLNGEKEVHRHVGVEPSGRGFNALCLDERNHNLENDGWSTWKRTGKQSGKCKLND